MNCSATKFATSADTVYYRKHTILASMLESLQDFGSCQRLETYEITITDVGLSSENRFEFWRYFSYYLHYVTFA